MSEQVKPADVAIVSPDTIKAFEKLLPRLEGALAAMLAESTQFTVVTDDNLAAVKDMTVSVRDTQKSMQDARMLVTEKLDRLKEHLMGPEKKAMDELNRMRKMLGDFENEKIRLNREATEKAEKERRRTQLIADTKAAIKVRITDMVFGKCSTIETEAAKFLTEGCKDIAEFDKRAKQFATAKWRIKQEDYDACFVMTGDLSPEDKTKLMFELKEEITYESMNAIYMEKAMPVLSHWMSKEKQLREEWVAKFAAKDQAERDRLDRETKERQERETKQQQDDLEKQRLAAQATISSEQALNTIEADFTMQATVQGLDKTGPKKKVLKFTGPDTLKPFVEIIFQVYANPKFTGIVKMKDGKQVLDDKGRPEYIDPVQYFIDQFLKLCDAKIAGTRVDEDAKVIVRR